MNGQQTTQYMTMNDAVSDDEIIRFQRFLLMEKYDTDSVLGDLKTVAKSQSNIACTHHMLFMDVIFSFILPL